MSRVLRWVAGACLLLCACQSQPRVVPAGEGRLLHVVLFWFQPGTPSSERDALVALYQQRVAEVAGVEWVFIGPPAGSPRNVVDGSYTLLAATLFRTREAERGWQHHPIHVELKQRFEPVLARVVVYDSLQ